MGQTVAIRERRSPAELVYDAEMEVGTETAYIGGWTPLGRAVFTYSDGELRPLRLAPPALVRGYAWGRAGVGPREVARAILLDATGNEMLAERLCRRYTWEVVSNLPTEGFRISKSQVLAWLGS
jgi:hypothetical protein